MEPKKKRERPAKKEKKAEVEYRQKEVVEPKEPETNESAEY